MTREMCREQVVKDLDELGHAQLIEEEIERKVRPHQPFGKIAVKIFLMDEFANKTHHRPREQLPVVHLSHNGIGVDERRFVLRYIQHTQANNRTIIQKIVNAS